MQPWLLGVDAGGTQTRAALWQYGSDRLLMAKAGPGNPWAVGSDFAADAIESACAQVLALAGMHLHEVSVATLGIAGFGRSGAPGGFEERIAMWGLPSASVVTSDLDIATVAGLGDRAGIHVVAGTGSALMAQLGPDERIPFGGWGWFLGDSGSAFDLGRRAMRWWAEAYDRGGPSPLFAKALAQWAGSEFPGHLPSRVAHPGPERDWIAKAAQVVVAWAGQGDADAQAILQESLEGLVRSVRSAAFRLPRKGPISLSFSGGMFRSSTFTDCYRNQLEGAGLEYGIVNTFSNPIEGALRISQKCLDLAVCENLKGVIASHYA